MRYPPQRRENKTVDENPHTISQMCCRMFDFGVKSYNKTITDGTCQTLIEWCVHLYALSFSNQLSLTLVRPSILQNHQCYIEFMENN